MALKLLRQRKTLPRTGSPLFEHITDRANLAPLGNSTISIKQRMQLVIALHNAITDLFKLYIRQMYRSTRMDHYRTEVIELAGQLMAVTVHMNRLTPQAWATLSAKQQASPVRREGLRKVKLGLAGLLAGALTMLREQKIYTVADRRRLARYVEVYLPQLAPYLEPKMRGYLKIGLDNLVRSQIDAQIRASMRRARAHIH